MDSRISDRMDLAVDASVTEAARHQYTVYACQQFFYIVRRHGLRIYPADIYHTMIGDAAVFQGFHHADIGVVQLCIFTDECNGHFTGRRSKRFHHSRPVGQIRLWAVQLQAFTRHLGQMLLLHGEGRFV